MPDRLPPLRRLSSLSRSTHPTDLERGHPSRHRPWSFPTDAHRRSFVPLVPKYAPDRGCAELSVPTNTRCMPDRRVPSEGRSQHNMFRERWFRIRTATICSLGVQVPTCRLIQEFRRLRSSRRRLLRSGSIPTSIGGGERSHSGRQLKFARHG